MLVNSQSKTLDAAATPPICSSSIRRRMTKQSAWVNEHIHTIHRARKIILGKRLLLLFSIVVGRVFFSKAKWGSPTHKDPEGHKDPGCLWARGPEPQKDGCLLYCLVCGTFSAPLSTQLCFVKFGGIFDQSLRAPSSAKFLEEALLEWLGQQALKITVCLRRLDQPIDSYPMLQQSSCGP